MVIAHTHCLHEGMDRGRADESPGPVLESLAQRRRLRRSWQERIWLTGCFRLELPNEACKGAELFNKFNSPTSVVDGGLDLASMTNYTRVLYQPFYATAVETGYLVEIKALERLAEVLPFSENRQPTQSRLKSFQAYFLEQTIVVSNREAPFIVVVVSVECVCSAPPAAGNSVFVGVQ